MTIISEGRVLKGKSLQAAIDYTLKSNQLSRAIDEAQAEQVRFALTIRAEREASFLEMANVIMADLGMTEEEFKEWIVLANFAPTTGVAVLVKVEPVKQLELNPATGLN